MDEFRNTITCIDRQGVINLFKYSLSDSNQDGKDVKIFKVIPESLQFTDFFEFTIQLIDQNTGKVVMMKHRNLQEYIAKGIPDKLIEEASKSLNLTIRSSSNHNSSGEYRTDEASKVWIRLVTRGLANYNKEEDFYFHTGSSLKE